MIGLSEFHPDLPIVAAIIVCVGLIAPFAFASLYPALYRYANQLAKRLVQDGPSQGVSEPEGSLAVLPSPDPKRVSIIPTIGKAFVLDTTERMPTS
jgi:hypothetical protein